MRSVLVFAVYVLSNRKLSATPPKCHRDPLRGRDPQVGNRCSSGCPPITDPCFTWETQQAIVAYKPPHITYYNSLI